MGLGALQPPAGSASRDRRCWVTASLPQPFMPAVAAVLRTRAAVAAMQVAHLPLRAFRAVRTAEAGQARARVEVRAGRVGTTNVPSCLVPCSSVHS